MGRVVTFAQLTPQKSDGVGIAAITRDDVREMSASYVRVEAGKRWSDRVPDGSDCYLFVVGGSGAIASDDARHAIARESFATIGHEVPVWDIRDKFGDTSLLVTDMDMGRDLAKTLGARPTALMRGHGCVVAAETLRKAVWVSIYLELNANLQMKAMALGDVKFLSPGEVDTVIARTNAFGIDRGWEYWCRRAGRPAGTLEID